MKQKLLLLIIDDSKLIRDRLIHLLSELNNTVEIVVGDCYEVAEKFLEKNSPDVVLSDIRLPGKSGIDLLHHIRERKYRIKKIIMMTDEPSKEKENLCKSLGADYFFNKFSEFEKIPEVISKIEIKDPL